MEDYEDAALRHHEDAHLLANEARYDNASHLIGVAAECALKNQMVLHGLNADKVHLPDLVYIYRAQMKGRRRVALDVVMQLVDGPQSFNDWHISDRYSKDGHVDEQLWERRRQKAGKLFTAFAMRKKS